MSDFVRTGVWATLSAVHAELDAIRAELAAKKGVCEAEVVRRVDMECIKGQADMLDALRAELAAAKAQSALGWQRAAEKDRAYEQLRASLEYEREKAIQAYDDTGTLWVDRFDEARATIRELREALSGLVDALPKCLSGCGRTATRAWVRGANSWCDVHGKESLPEAPITASLRRAIALLEKTQ